MVKDFEYKKRDYRRELTDNLISLMEAGNVPWERPWVQLERPRNFVSGKPYQGINFLALSMKDHIDPRWMTFNQANKLGMKIRAGERGTVVEHWQWNETKTVIDENTGKEKEIEVPLKWPRAQRWTVFNGEQIEGMPEYKLDKGVFDQLVATSIQKAEEVIKQSNASIKRYNMTNAFYNYQRDEICIPNEKLFKGKQNELATILHELAHWTGHESRLNRETLKGYDHDKNRPKEELCAELASYFIGVDTGIGTDRLNRTSHAPYVKAWVKALQNDKNEIYQAAREAEKIVRFLTKDLELAKDKHYEPARPEVETEGKKEEKIYQAKTKNNMYKGAIISIDEGFVVQKVGADSLVKHERLAIKDAEALKTGDNVVINYIYGEGTITVLGPLRAAELNEKAPVIEKALTIREPYTEKSIYNGEIVKTDATDLYQKVSNSSLIRHSKNALGAETPGIGENVRISYSKGVVKIKPMSKEKDRDIEVGMEL